MNQPRKKLPEEPSFVRGVIRSAIPLALAIGVVYICGLLVYLFWFGAESITDWILN